MGSTVPPATDLQALLTRARAFADRDALEDAQKAYAVVLDAAPEHLDALVEAGIVAVRLEQTGAAQAHFAAALKIAPDEPVVHMNLAELARLTGDLETAAAHYEACLRADADDVDALFGLGDTLRMLERTREAHPLLLQAVRAAPDDPEILNAFAIASEALGQRERARQAYRRAVALSPDFQNARVNLALSLSMAGEVDEACALFAEADRREPLAAAALMGWANAALRADAFEAAEDLCDRATAAGADTAQVLSLRGTIRERTNRFDAARDAYLAAVERDPSAGYAWSRLAHMNQLPASARGTLEALLDNASVHASSRSQAGFALYRLLERSGEFEAAFDALDRANTFAADREPFDRERARRAADKTFELFDAGFLKSAPPGCDREGPIFIVGMPRSGTTLVEQILAHFGEVHAGGERADIQALVRSLPGYPNVLKDMPEGWAREAGGRIFAAMTADAPRARLATNKTPANYQHCGLISMLFPRARIIYCRRDPRDVGLSIFAQDFRDGIDYAYDLGDIAFVYGQHMRYMRHWFDVLPMRIHTVDYESLVHDPVPEARAVVDYCGLEWDDRCVATHEVRRPVHTASVWQVSQPIYTASVGKWKNYERRLGAFIKEVEAV